MNARAPLNEFETYLTSSAITSLIEESGDYCTAAKSITKSTRATNTSKGLKHVLNPCISIYLGLGLLKTAAKRG